MKPTSKRDLLKALLSGDTSELRRHKASQPPAYTPQRKEERRAYLSELLDHPCTDEEFTDFWGRYDIERWQTPDQPLLYVELPNGLKHYPRYCHGHQSR